MLPTGAKPVTNPADFEYLEVSAKMYHRTLTGRASNICPKRISGSPSNMKNQKLEVSNTFFIIQFFTMKLPVFSNKSK